MRGCYIKIKKDWEKAKFVGVFQRSQVIPPSIAAGGHSGGVVAYPVAVVLLENGEMDEIYVNRVKFDKEVTE